MDLTIMLAGEAGQGIATAGHILAKALARSGYYLFANQDYESRIRGGHNLFQIRVREEPVYAPAEALHLLIALNRESVELHQGELASGGMVLGDGEKLSGPEDRFLPIPLESLALERGGSRLTGNSVALGAAVGLVGADLPRLEGVLRERFPGPAGAANLRAARAGWEHARAHFPPIPYSLPPREAPPRMLLNGNEAIALGALAAGCKVMTGYPMSPATPIMEYLAGKQERCGLVVLQAEDEIAVMLMALGASFAGVRAMVATSGGGFCLMVEGLALAGMTETPIVIVEGQRGGPATGLPTRTEQGDLLFLLHAGHGEFPRAVLAPATPQDAFELTVQAFNLADKYQIPVFILGDVYLADSYHTIPPPNFSRVKIERGEWVGAGQAQGYLRHRLTPSGVSPRALPGTRGALVITTGDEHTEEGHITEDPQLRRDMVEKRLRKGQGLKGEMGPPLSYGPADAELTLVGWGSTYGALREAVDMLRGEGVGARLVHFTQLYPFPTPAAQKALKGAKRLIAVEQNATGQFARLLQAETGLSVDGQVLKYDGRPITPAYILREVKKEMKG